MNPAHRTPIPELLAPAGGPAALRAAIANGADAVYLGVETLNARRGAENFSAANLADVCAFAHLRGTKVYLTANVVVLPDEMPVALELVDSAWQAGVDAVIVQDLGLLWALRHEMPHVRIHASTQMNAHNTVTLDALESLRVARVTLAREVSIAEIGGFAAATGVEIESFVHGALCMCYSGQCLMSSLIGRRSANRGLCAQPCRLPYELVGEDGMAADTAGTYLLSPKDLAGISVLPRLVATGVSALKIEGRMKSAEYVALVTGVYRAALDRVAADSEGFEVREGEQSVLAESFSRGFTESYLLGERGNEMMSYRRPNNRGVAIGRVTQVEAGRATIALDASVDAADTIEFWTSSGHFAQVAGRLVYDSAEHEFAPAGAKACVQVERSVTTGDRVFRVRNAALSSAASRTFADPDAASPIGLAFTVRVVVGAPLRVEVSDAQGRSGVAEAEVVQAARTKAVTAEEISEHIGRLGGTPYHVASWDLELSPSVGIGFSALHRARRDAIAEYESAVLAAWAGRKRARPRAPQPRPLARGSAKQRPQLVARVAEMVVAQACLEAGADAVQVPTFALGSVKELRRGTVPLLPRIAHDREVGAALGWAMAGSRLVTGNLGLLRAATLEGASVEADWSLNALNSPAVAQLEELGASFVWLSPELSGRQIADVIATSPLPAGTAVYGRQELMVTEHCILMAEGECDRRCGACERRRSARALRDRKGYAFPVRTDPTGRSHVYNSVPLDLTPSLLELIDAGVAALRIDLEVETSEQAAAVVTRVREALERAMAGIQPPARDRQSGTTSGHFYRGAL